MTLTNPADVMERAGSQKHIMISYCHQQKAIVRKLFDNLSKQLKTPIWIDDEKMHKGQDIANEMAQAVENASWIICCYSDAYGASENCMLEFQYANYCHPKQIVYVCVQENCRPKGKLGLHVSGKYYFDLSTPNNYKQNIPKLLEKLESK